MVRKTIRRIIGKIRNAIFQKRYITACSRAKKFHDADGKTYLMLLFKGRPVVVDKQKVKQWIAARKVKKGVTIQMVEKGALYIAR